MKSYLKTFGEFPKGGKQEVLSFWRKTGFLEGLKAGGIMEWRCAKSFNNFALEIWGSEEDVAPFDMLLFPMARRLITTGRYKVHRIIKYDEIVSILKSHTIRELLGVNEPLFPKSERRLFKGITNYFNAPDPADRLNPEKSLMDKVIWECFLDKNNYIINQWLFSYYTGCNLKAEIIAMMCYFIQHKIKFGEVKQ